MSESKLIIKLPMLTSHSDYSYSKFFRSPDLPVVVGPVAGPIEPAGWGLTLETRRVCCCYCWWYYYCCWSKQRRRWAKAHNPENRAAPPPVLQQQAGPTLSLVRQRGAAAGGVGCECVRLRGGGRRTNHRDGGQTMSPLHHPLIIRQFYFIFG